MRRMANEMHGYEMHGCEMHGYKVPGCEMHGYKMPGYEVHGYEMHGYGWLACLEGILPFSFRPG